MSLVLTIPGRPLSSNDRGHWRMRAQQIAAVRHEAKIEARAQWGLPRPLVFPVAVTVEDHTRTKQLRDTANAHPSVKAIIDGIVDSGWLPDDTAEFVASITYLPCRCTGKNELVLMLDEGPRSAP